MRIFGSIINASTKQAVKDARIIIKIGEYDIATSSDREGHYNCSEDVPGHGDVQVTVEVEHQQYKPNKVSFVIKINEDKPDLNFELAPLNPPDDPFKLEISIKDRRTNALLTGARLVVEVDGEQIGNGQSDSQGLVRLPLDPRFKGQTGTFTATLKGYHIATRAETLHHNTNYTITMDRDWRRLIISMAVGLLAVAIIGILLHKCTPPPKPPEILSFEVDHPTITHGQRVKLSWKTSEAKEVILDDRIVLPSGSEEIRPGGTKTYELIAKNQGGSVTKTVRVTVEPVKPPEVLSFTTEPSTIKKGQEAKLEWKTSNADRVTLDGEQVPFSSSKTVRPDGPKTYELVARSAQGEAKKQLTVTVTLSRGPQQTTGTNKTTANGRNSIIKVGPSTTNPLEPEPPSPEPPKVLYFQISPPGIRQGGRAELSWGTQHASKVTLDGQNVPIEGNKEVQPNSTKTYRLTATNAAGQSTESMVTITVTKP